MRRRLGACLVLLGACSTTTSGEPEVTKDAGAHDAGRRGDAKAETKADASIAIQGLTLRSDVRAIERAEDALPGVFIPPYVSCEGEVCTNVAISGSTAPGLKFAERASCDIVMTQRPFWSVPPWAESKPDDPRLNDQAYLAELGWVTEQVEASGCVCCHDSNVLGKQAGEWDIRLGPLWLVSLSDTGLALFAGLADSSVLGAYAPGDNNGFNRDITGIPSDDSARMQKFMLEELARRGISEDEARAVPPFGGPIYANRVAVPTDCGPGEGVAPDGSMVWKGPDARYVYVMREDSANPGVPPNLDLPEGTLFRLDVLASQPAIKSGLAYGTTPAGSFQFAPERERAPALQDGTRYHFYVLKDVGLPLANCLFTFGEPLAAEPPDAGVVATPTDASSPSDAASSCALPDEGWGATCKTDAECPCAANYCALMPGQTSGYCTKTGCKTDPSVCPSGWSCFDLSLFSAGLPAICTN